MDGRRTDPWIIVAKPHLDWGRGSAQQLRQVLVDSDGDNMHLTTCADAVLEHCEVCRVLDKAPHDSAAGTFAVAMFSEELLADLLFSDDIIALRIMKVSSERSLLTPVRTKNPQEV